MTRQFLALAAVGSLALASGCATDPTSSLQGTPAFIETSLASFRVNVGDSVRVTAQLKDAQGVTLATLPSVSSSDAAVVTVDTTTGVPLSQLVFYVRGTGFGATTVLVTSGTIVDTINVEAYPASIGITGVASTLRSGETATITLTALDAQGNAITGVPDLTVETGDEDVLALDTATLVVTADQAGASVLSASGPGGSSGDLTVIVTSGPPATATLAAVPGLAADDTAYVKVVIADAAGNENNLAAEITGAAATSSDNGVTTATAAIVDTLGPDDVREVWVRVTGEGSGTATISGTVTTSAGVLNFGGPAQVLDPVVTSTALATVAGGNAVIVGSGFMATGFRTRVLVDGEYLGNVTVDSDNQITAQMPTYGTAGSYDFEVEVGGVVSNTGTWTLAVGFDESEATNDDPATAPVISASFNFTGAFEGAPEEDDFFVFTVTEAVTLVIDLDWNPSKDLDILVTDDAGDFVCTDGATGAEPEQSVCELEPGTYVLWLNDYDAAANGLTTPVTYTVIGRIQ